MQVQLTTNTQNSNPAFGKIYKFKSNRDISSELYRILIEKGAQPPRDFIGGELSIHNNNFHLATGEDSFTPPGMMGMTNGLIILGEKVQKAGAKVIEIIIDGGRRIEEQLNITLRPTGNNGIQEIDITKI